MAVISQYNLTQTDKSEKVVKTAVISQCNLTQTDKREKVVKNGSDFTMQSYTNGQSEKVVKNGSDFTMQSYTNGQKWESGKKWQWFHNAIIHKRTKGKKWSKKAVISQCNHTQTKKSEKVIKNGSDYTMQSYTSRQ